MSKSTLSQLWIGRFRDPIICSLGCFGAADSCPQKHFDRYIVSFVLLWYDYEGKIQEVQL